MPLQDGQIQIRGLTLGCGTPYQVWGFNPWNREARAESTPRAWAHGTWSGAEWQAEIIIPFRVLIQVGNTAEWLALHQALTAAFRPVGDSTDDVELRWSVAGREYAMYGRPRSVDVDTDGLRMGRGKSRKSLAFAALDPLVYSGTDTETVVPLPAFTGGLTLPTTVPFTVDADLIGGATRLTNAGTADAPLRIRLDGPLSQPWIALQHDAGGSVVLRAEITLASGQWLDLDTGTRTALLNGKQPRLGQITGEWPLLPPGTHTIQFRSSDGTGTATVTHRSVWW